MDLGKLDSPLQDDAKPLSRQRESRLVARGPNMPLVDVTDKPERDHTLTNLCRAVVSDHLERYPPEAMGMLSEHDWESIVKCRHHRKAPKEGTGGLDGTGRVAPAISSKYLAAVERCNAHLAESAVVDELVWKDCVNFKFKLKSPTRPLAFAAPWPVLIQQLTAAGEELDALRRNHHDKTLLPLSSTSSSSSSMWSEEEEAQVLESVQIFKMSPMSVSLLKTTGIGKALKKFIKAFSTRKEAPDTATLPSEQLLTELEKILQAWMELADRDGVPMNNHAAVVSQRLSNDEEKAAGEEEDMRIAQSCSTWRALFLSLEDRESRCRANQGMRMRELSRKLDSDRPKIVKVRASRSKHDNILERAGIKTSHGGSASSTPSKLQQIKKETFLMASRREGVPVSNNRKGSGGAFGNAVAFAAGNKKNAAKRKPTTTIELGGGKRMSIPNRPHNITATSKANLKNANSYRR